MGKRGPQPFGTSASAVSRHQNAPQALPASGRPVPPSTLSDAARAQWRRLVGSLPKGSVGRSDSPTLALTAEVMADLAACRAAFEAEGSPWDSPLARHMLKQQGVLVGLLTKLGATPADRAKVPPPVKADKGRIARFTGIA